MGAPDYTTNTLMTKRYAKLGLAAELIDVEFTGFCSAVATPSLLGGTLFCHLAPFF